MKFRQVDEEKQKPGFVTTIARLNRRRVGIVLMMSIYCHLSGVGIVTAYLVDIFASTLNALTLVLVSSSLVESLIFVVVGKSGPL